MKLALIGTAGLVAVAAAPAAAEDWPTPYTAEQIRDAWGQGFWLDTRVETADGERLERTEVLEWSEEGATLRSVPVDADEATLAAAESMNVTWEELRRHALFDKTRTARRRATRETPLGTLDGWIYSTMSTAGSAMYFFADDLPGPPVEYSKIGRDGQLKYRAVQIARKGLDVSTVPEPDAHDHGDHDGHDHGDHDHEHEASGR